MQLLVLVLMMLAAGKKADFKELKPILENFGGGEAANAVKKAEELSEMLTAVQSIATMAAASAPAPTPATAGEDNVPQQPFAEKEEGEGYPLAPVSGIADERITYCLSGYIALGE